MPPPRLLDLSTVDLDAVRFTREDIYRCLPQRHEFEALDGLCHLDREAGTAVGFRDLSANDWWARGHLPGRPIFPGALMLETAAQLAGFLAGQLGNPDMFVAFGGVDDCKFRDAVRPPARIYFVCLARKQGTRQIVCDSQAISGDAIIFEARITGMITSYDRL